MAWKVEVGNSTLMGLSIPMLGLLHISNVGREMVSWRTPHSSLRAKVPNTMPRAPGHMSERNGHNSTLYQGLCKVTGKQGPPFIPESGELSGKWLLRLFFRISQNWSGKQRGRLDTRHLAHSLRAKLVYTGTSFRCYVKILLMEIKVSGLSFIHSLIPHSLTIYDTPGSVLSVGVLGMN